MSYSLLSSYEKLVENVNNKWYCSLKYKQNKTNVKFKNVIDSLRNNISVKSKILNDIRQLKNTIVKSYEVGDYIREYKIIKDLDTRERGGNVYEIKIQDRQYILKVTIEPDELKIAKIASRHELGPKIYDSWTDNSKSFIVMEKMKKSLKEYILEGNEFSESLQDQVLNVLKKLHSLDILHNDATTSNWMFSADKKIKLIDFGDSEINKNISEGDSCGEIKMLYMSLKYSCELEDYQMKKIKKQYDVWCK